MNMELQRHKDYRVITTDGQIVRHAGEKIIITMIRNELDKMNRNDQPEFIMVNEGEVALSLTVAVNMCNAIMQHVELARKEISAPPTNGKKPDDPMCR